MTTLDRQRYIKALAERSSYVENVLLHEFVAQLSALVWSRDPNEALQVFNAEVDDSGFDLVLSYQSHVRYIQLKQTHDEKIPIKCSVRLSFADVPGSCVVLMSHSIQRLELTAFRFFGGTPGSPMPTIGNLKASKMPGRRSKSGERKVRAHYRDLPIRSFVGPMTAIELLDTLFPKPHAA
jgi:hypothetical protein